MIVVVNLNVAVFLPALGGWTSHSNCSKVLYKDVVDSNVIGFTGPDLNRKR